MSEIPERWRDHYEQCEEGFPLAAAVGTHVLQQLGTAESLVRALAGVLQDAVHEIAERRATWDWDDFHEAAKATLSRIPKEMLPK